MAGEDDGGVDPAVAAAAADEGLEPSARRRRRGHRERDGAAVGALQVHRRRLGAVVQHQAPPGGVQGTAGGQGVAGSRLRHADRRAGGPEGLVDRPRLAVVVVAHGDPFREHAVDARRLEPRVGDRATQAGGEDPAAQLRGQTAVAVEGSAGELRVDPRAARTGALRLLQDQDRAALGEHQAGPLRVEGAVGAAGLAHRPAQQPRALVDAEDVGHQRRLEPSGVDHGGVALADGQRPQEQRLVPARPVGHDRLAEALDPLGDAPLALGRGEEPGDRLVGADAIRSDEALGVELALGELHAAEDVGEVHPDLSRIFRAQVEPGVLGGHPARREGHVGGAIGLLDGEVGQEVRGPELGDGSADPAGVVAGVEPVDGADERAAAQGAVPERVAAQAVRRHDAEPGDHDPALGGALVSVAVVERRPLARDAHDARSLVWPRTSEEWMPENPLALHSATSIRRSRAALGT